MKSILRWRPRLYRRAWRVRYAWRTVFWGTLLALVLGWLGTR